MAFRKRLWRHLLGKSAGVDSWQPADFVMRWDQIAQANVNKRGGAARSRSGFIVPHDPDVVTGTDNLVPALYTEAVPEDSDTREAVV